MKNNKNNINIIISLCLIGISYWFYMGGGLEQSVASKLIKEYQVAKSVGDYTSASFRAGAVAEAYLQADDKENYTKWKNIEAEEEELSKLNQK